MISIEDCIAMCGLTREEVDAIGEHEHLQEIGATALAFDLMHRKGGPETIRKMIRDDIYEAIERGDKAHARELVTVLQLFVSRHPDSIDARPGEKRLPN